MTFKQAVAACLLGKRVRHPGMPEGDHVAAMRNIIFIYPKGGRQHQHMPSDWWARSDWEIIT